MKKNPFIELLPRAFKVQIPDIQKLGPGCLAIDCGANIGEVTSLLARTGCDVIAFEPNPYCNAYLDKRFKFRKNITVVPCAVSDSTGIQDLYLHKDLEGLSGSEASSLEKSKHNLDPAKAVHVKTLILSEYLLNLNRRVSILKIDVEGHEDIVLKDLMENNAFSLIDKAVVEVHDDKYDFMKPRISDLKKQISAMGLEYKINLNWH